MDFKHFEFLSKSLKVSLQYNFPPSVSVNIFPITFPSCHPTEGVTQRAAHLLGPPGSLLPRRQVLPTPRDAEEAIRHPPHAAAQAYSVKQAARWRRSLGCRGKRKTAAGLDSIRLSVSWISCWIFSFYFEFLFSSE